MPIFLTVVPIVMTKRFHPLYSPMPKLDITLGRLDIIACSILNITKIHLRVLPTVEILNITQKYEIKAHLRGRSFLSVLGRLKRTSVPG